jgi:hypothetical protein
MMFRVAITCVLFAASLSSQQPRVDLRIGEVEGDENYMFHQVTSGGVARSGELVVFNGGTSQVRIYSPTGRFVRAFGRRGGGPGEFDRFGGYVLVAGDEVVVRDGQRNQFFDLNGKLLRAFSRASGVPYAYPVGRGPAGWIATTRVRNVNRAAVAGKFYTDSVQVDLLDSGGKPSRRLLSYPSARMVGLPGGGTGELSTYYPMFDQTPRLGVDGSGRLYVTDREQYRITVYDANGKAVRVITRPHRPVRVTQALIDAYTKHANEYYLKRPERRTAKPTLEERLASPKAEHLPALGDLFVADDGSVWVERPDLVKDPAIVELRRTMGTDVAPAPGTTWDRFDAHGCFLGSVELPPKLRPLQVTRDTILGVQADENDVEFIVRYRVTGVCKPGN